MKRRAFTIIESLAMIVTIMVFTLILAAIMRQRHMWPFDKLDAWLDSKKALKTISK